MKKIFTLSISVLFGLHTAFAQCTPDASITVPNIYNPEGTTEVVSGLDTLFFLPPATPDMSYEAVFNMLVPTDTLVDLTDFGVPGGVLTVALIDLSLTGIEGLPEGFTYSCDNAECAWPPLVPGCIAITGFPTLDQVGEYPLTVLIDATGDVPFFGEITLPIPLENYVLSILPLGLEDGLQSFAFEILNVSPNPFSKETKFVVSTADAKQVRLQVYDILGNKIVDTFYPCDSKSYTEIYFSADNLQSGLYMYTLSNGKNVETGRLIVNK